MTQTKLLCMLLFTALMDLNANVFAQEVKHGTVVTETLTSTILSENRTGLDPNRRQKRGNRLFLWGYIYKNKSIEIITEHLY